LLNFFWNAEATEMHYELAGGQKDNARNAEENGRERESSEATALRSCGFQGEVMRATTSQRKPRR